MDTYRALEDQAEADYRADDEPAMERPPEIGVDERRMHVRAYNYWVSLLGGRAYPSIQDLDPANIDDFGPHSVLLDFTSDSEDPRIAFVGRSLKLECGLGETATRISDVPSRSLLSRLTDHYLQIIANCAPIGFEAEFVGQRGHMTMYRGILMPFSSNGDTIDFIYGVINWKELVDPPAVEQIVREVDRAIADPNRTASSPIWADGPNAEPLVHGSGLALGDEGGGYGDGVAEAGQTVFELTLPANAALADRLCFARESAEAVRSAEARSRSALYHALGQAYDFAIAADEQPDDYAELLEDAGLKAQARAPMTPVVKLVFGAGYDKTRLTEFAAALAHGRREGVTLGAFRTYLENYRGGLKGIVQAERGHRRPASRPDPSAGARAQLRSLRPLAFLEAGAAQGGDAEFVLLVARREGDGRLAVVAPVAADTAMLDRALRIAAR